MNNVFDDSGEELHEGNFEVVQDRTATEEEVVPALPSEDQIAAYVHHHRVKMVKHLTKNNTSPGDPKEMLILLSALKDMDGSALARKRLAVEATNGDITAGATAVIAKLLTQLPNDSKRVIDPAVVRTIPRLGADVPPPELLDGETATTLPQQSYDTFMSKFSPPPENPK